MPVALLAAVPPHRGLVALLGWCIVALLGTPSAARAAAEITVSPSIVQLEGRAGETLTQPISVTAGSDEAITVELVHADFGFDDTSYEVTLILDDARETTSFSTRGWFGLPREQYRVPAGRTVELPLRIRIPPNTPGGTYLGAALIRVAPPRTRDGASQVQAVPQTGPLLFIAVEGGDPPRPRLRRFEVPRFVTRGPIRPELVVENRGDEFFSYEGTIELRGPGRDDEVEVARQFVVPGQPRRLRTSPEARGSSARLELGKRSMPFGRYEVRTKLRIDPTGTTLRSTRTVWVVPIWLRVAGLLLALLLAACIAVLVGWFLVRRSEGRAEATPAGVRSEAPDDEHGPLDDGHEPLHEEDEPLGDEDDDGLHDPYDDPLEDEDPY